jgi:hypothetical protein
MGLAAVPCEPTERTSQARSPPATGVLSNCGWESSLSLTAGAAVCGRRTILRPPTGLLPPAGRALDDREEGTAVNPVSAAYVAKGEAVGAIGGGGRWKSTDSKTETRPVVPWTGIPMPGNTPNSLSWLTDAGL